MTDKIEVAKVLIENDEGKFLALQKSDSYDWKAGKWELPGGKIEEELGEDRLDAARREVKDEAGLKVKSLVDAVRVEVGEFKPGKPAVNCFILYSDSYSGEVQLSEEHQNYEWVTAEEFKRMDWHRDAGYVIPSMTYLKEYLANRGE